MLCWSAGALGLCVSGDGAPPHIALSEAASEVYYPAVLCLTSLSSPAGQNTVQSHDAAAVFKLVYVQKKMFLPLLRNHLRSTCRSPTH